MHKTVRGDCRVSDCARTEMSDRKGKDSYDPEVGQDVDGILVLGGDGTLLRAARDLAGRKIPFLGINLGHLGYLAEIEEQNVTSALDRLIEGCYTVENRMMLEGTVYREGKQTFHDLALNDIVMNRSRQPQVVIMMCMSMTSIDSFTADC